MILICHSAKNWIIEEKTEKKIWKRKEKRMKGKRKKRIRKGKKPKVDQNSLTLPHLK